MQGSGRPRLFALADLTNLTNVTNAFREGVSIAEEPKKTKVCSLFSPCLLVPAMLRHCVTPATLAVAPKPLPPAARGLRWMVAEHFEPSLLTVDIIFITLQGRKVPASGECVPSSSSVSSQLTAHNPEHPHQVPEWVSSLFRNSICLLK